jgi:acetyl esterase
MVDGQEPPIEIHRVQNMAIPTPTGDLPARGYWPSKEKGLAIMLYWHGGGWQMGNVDSVDRPVRAFVKRANLIVISTTHRLSPEHKYPTAVEDGYAAVRWLGEHAAELGGDPARVIVGGESSGGNVAAAVALKAREMGGPAIAHQFLVTPTVDPDLERQSCIAYGENHLLTKLMLKLVWRRYLGPELSRHLDAKEYDSIPELAAPLRAATLAGLPPATVIACECDPHCDEDQEYAARLQQAGVPTTLRTFPGLTHGALNFAGVSAAAQRYSVEVAELLAEAARETAGAAAR